MISIRTRNWSPRRRSSRRQTSSTTTSFRVPAYVMFSPTRRLINWSHRGSCLDADVWYRRIRHDVPDVVGNWDIDRQSWHVVSYCAARGGDRRVDVICPTTSSCYKVWRATTLLSLSRPIRLILVSSAVMSISVIRTMSLRHYVVCPTVLLKLFKKFDHPKLCVSSFLVW